MTGHREHFTYGYDRVSNRLYRENTSTSGLDEFYTYDDINRLATFDRGDLNANKDAITGTPANEEDWSLDMTGNWTDFTQKTAGNTDLDQDRTQNEVNEITNITETTGTAWITPVQDKNGNMTTVPKPSSLANGLTLEYDAWNRLVEVKDGATVIGLYEYDARNRRVKRHLDIDSPADPDGLDTYVHYFYNNNWQTLETRQTTTESDQPENLQPKHQYIWSPRYIDAPILRDENTDQDSLCDDQRLYYLTDANFNTTALVDSSGDALERYIYDPYGKLTIYDATWSNTRSTSSYDNVVLYTGRELDSESGMMHYRNRYYHARLGRFLGRDPIGYEAGYSLYEYVAGRPTLYTDPSGEQVYFPWKAPTEKQKKEKEVQDLWEKLTKVKTLFDFWAAIKDNKFVTLNDLINGKGWDAVFNMMKGLEDFADSNACKDWYVGAMNAVKSAADSKSKCGSCGDIVGSNMTKCYWDLYFGKGSGANWGTFQIASSFETFATILAKECAMGEKCPCHHKQ